VNQELAALVQIGLTLVCRGPDDFPANIFSILGVLLLSGLVDHYGIPYSL